MFNMNEILNQYKVANKSKGFLCYGTKKDCWADIQRGGIQLSFGKHHEVTDITRATLNVDIKKIEKCRNLDFLSSQLTHLSIPLALINLIDANKLPNLEHLTVRFPYPHKHLNIESENCKLDKQLNLKSFKFFADDPLDETKWHMMDIDLLSYKNLEFVSLSLDDSNSCINLIKRLQHVKYFSLNSDLYTKNDVLSLIPRQAELIVLPLNENSQILNQINEFSKLNYLEIRNLTSPFDCELISKNQNLVEISLLNCKKIDNPLYLLEIPSLKIVTLMDCRNPLKKKGKELFYQHGFNELDIEYS